MAADSRAALGNDGVLEEGFKTTLKLTGGKGRKGMKVAVYSSSAEWKQYMEACFRLCEEEIQPLEVDF